MNKICIIKLGALGDVVRTLPIAKALKSKFPDAEIDWITKKEAQPLVQGSKYVDNVYTLPFLPQETYEFLYNFDLEEEATSLASEIQAREKKGFYSQDGFPVAFNPGAEYYLNTLFDDELKKNNRKTYQQMMFEAADLEYKGEHLGIVLGKEEKEYSQSFIDRNLLQDEKIIGIHIGASSRWPSKSWHPDRVKEFIRKVNENNHAVILFGGPNEVDKHEQLVKELSEEGVDVYRNNPLNSVKEFASLVDLCDVIVCSDSFALHIALALKKPSIGLFFVTSPHEIEDYGVLRKVVSHRLPEFFPERSDQYDEELTKSITAEQIIDIIEEISEGDE
ncbi:MAG: glycosyltransferase family 9 protein [Nanoarchaeota archaeon]|nr:glycosyltransferase family 9 protein [Nanoarchaeota archaeon]